MTFLFSSYLFLAKKAIFSIIKLGDNMKRRIRKEAIIVLIIGVALIILIITGIKNVIYHQTNEYKFKKLGYTDEEVTTFLKLDKDIQTKYLKLDYNENLAKLVSQKYFIQENLDLYLDALKEDDDIKKVVAKVNVLQNRDFYEDITDADPSKKELILVNKFYKLKEDYTPDNLVSMGVQYSYDGNYMQKEADEAFSEMWADADENGLSIIANLAYRSYKVQEESYAYYKDDLGTKSADKVVARPGHSEHQTGLCVDIDIYRNYEGEFDETDEFKWLKKNAYKYGFILRYPKDAEDITGFKYEPWHYRYVGKKVAKEIYNKGITLDEYYAYYLK